VRPPGDPAAIARGQQIYSANCAACHGSDTRGGETGPNLPRSQVVLDDRSGELIGPIVRDGRPNQQMPKFDFKASDLADLVEFIHSVPVNLRGAGPSLSLNVLVGDAAAGETYFKGKCASCHAVTGDLRGIGSRFDARTLQNFWVSGGGGAGRGGAPNPNSKPTTVTVTPASGSPVEGKLERIDDFSVSLIDAAGDRRSFRRDSETSPKVEVHNPRQPHIDLLTVYTDTDIHNVTAYLMTVK
jgi:mono/diheme cytochrome c family protein